MRIMFSNDIYHNNTKLVCPKRVLYAKINLFLVQNQITLLSHIYLFQYFALKYTFILWKCVQI